MKIRRRELLKGAACSAIAGTALAQTPSGPFSLPTATFKKENQHEYPAYAFQSQLPIPRVPRPTAIGTWNELMQGELRTRAFGPGDSTPIGESFHGIAREWMQTPPHWHSYGCAPQSKVTFQGDATKTLARSLESGWESWQDKEKCFGTIRRYDQREECGDSLATDSSTAIYNWGGGPHGLPIKCYKLPILEAFKQLPGLRHPTRFYTYGGFVPGPTLKIRLGQPMVIRYENHLEAEMSIHLHGGHSPSHSDGFPSFYVLQGKARDYFYPNIVPLYRNRETGAYHPDVGESQSTMWYHDHAMDATAYNVSKGLAGFAPCFGEEELCLIRRRVLPGLGEASCIDPELHGFVLDEAGRPSLNLEDPQHPGFYRQELGSEPYFNPFDIPLVLQDRVFDEATGQIAYDNTGHNGYIGETMLINGMPWPYLEVERRKYRFRILDGSNARVFRLRLMSAEKFYAANRDGIDSLPLDLRAPMDGPTPPLLQPQTIRPVIDENSPEALRRRPVRYDAASEPFLRIGKDSWLWSHAVRMKAMVLMMANRADIVIDFGKLTQNVPAGETREFFLVNTMPQFDGRGPKVKLEDGGDPRVLPVPFDVEGVEGVENQRLVEVNRPIPLMKFVVHGPPVLASEEATVEHGTPLIRTHRRIEDHEVRAVREFIFERGKGAWEINGRFYDPTIANAGPILDGAEEWVLRNGGGGWWHPIHIHLESHQLISYEKNFDADAIIDRRDPPAPVRSGEMTNLFEAIPLAERMGFHDTQALGPNTVARIRIRTRTWNGPFVFHCHNLEHEDMRMMFNFEPVPSSGVSSDQLPNVAPTARTHGNDVTYQGAPRSAEETAATVHFIGELPWEYPPVPQTPVKDSGEDLIPPRPRTLD